MTEPLQVGQFAIVDHEPVDRGPNAGVFHGRGPADDRAELYLVAEGTTPAGEAFAGHVISAAGTAWNTLDMSLTGALRRLFVDAERNLRDWNRKSIAQHRVSIGMACFGRRGPQAVIAQAGPGAAFHLHAGRVHAYFADEEHARPLGADGSVEPQLTRIDFAPGDRVLLITTPALRELDDELIGGILKLEGERILAELYHRLQHVRNLSVLLVQKPRGRASGLTADDDFVIDATGGATPPAPEPEPPAAPAPEAITIAPRSTYQPSLFIDDDRNEDAVTAARRRLIHVTERVRHGTSAAPLTPAEIPQPLRRAAGDNTLAVLAAEHRAQAAMATMLIMPRQGWHGSASTIDTLSGDPRRRHRRDSFTRSLVTNEPAPMPEPLTTELPLCDDLAENLRTRASAVPASPVTDAIAGDNASTISNGGSLVRVRENMGGRWKAGGSLSSRRAVTAGQMPPTWLVILVGLGILLTLVGFVTIPDMLNRDNEARYANLLEEAQRQIADGRANPDPAARRANFTQAQALLLEARDVEGAGLETESLITEVVGALAAMDAVREPALVEQVASLEQFGEKPVSAARLVVTAANGYVLDSASAQVIGITLENGERKVVFAEDKDAAQGQPIAVATAEGADIPGVDLLVADNARALWGVDTAGTVHALEFAPPKGLAITDMALQGRDLYVLDAAAAAIYRFAPTANGYGVAPVTVLETPDLAAARRLLIDNEVVTADADGTIHRFIGQLALVLSEAGIDKRLVEGRQPNRIGDGDDIAMVDAANDRIVVFRADGAFDHQYQHPDFKGISALTMTGDIGYVFAGGRLLRVNFQ